jgi:hypothetical protein
MWRFLTPPSAFIQFTASKRGSKGRQLEELRTCKILRVPVMKGRQIAEYQTVKPTECRLFDRREKSHKMKAARK